MIPLALNTEVVVVPRFEPTNITLTVVDEYTDEVLTSEDIAFTYEGGYLVFNYDQTTKVDSQYTMKITETNLNTVIFKGKCLGASPLGFAVFIGENALIINTNNALFI